MTQRNLSESAIYDALHAEGARMSPSIAMKHYWIALISLFFATWSLRADDTNSIHQHATAVGEGVLRLLQIRDAASFANALAATNKYNRRQVLDSAQLVLDQATRLGLEPPVCTSVSRRCWPRPRAHLRCRTPKVCRP